MNPRPWLILSLALNVALAGLLGWAALARPGGPTPFSVAQQLTNRTLRVRKVVRESAPATVEVTAPFHWSEVESTDYRLYIANLRALGCPERTIRDIIVADLDQLYTARLHDLFAPLHRNVWLMLAKFDDLKEDGERYEKAWEAMKEERATVLKELLGREKPFQSDDEEEQAASESARQARLLDFLPMDKQETVLAARKQFEDAKRRLGESDHQLTKEERETRQQKQRELEAGFDRELAGLLTPAELAEYRLRQSPAAAGLLRESRVEFSEDELRAIARITAAREEGEQKLKQNTPEARQQRETLARQSEAELRTTLGEARCADYQRAKDGRYEQLCQVAERHGLEEATPTAVFGLMQEAEGQARRLREDAARSVEERTELLKAVRAETERAVAAELGARAFATYTNRGGESWLGQLATPPKP